MAYNDNSNSGNSGKTAFKGFSSQATNSNFKQYDFECVKQDLLNRLSIRKGERVENPEFGTIIYDVLFEPLTASIKEQILDDVTANLNADPRLSTEDIIVSETDYGIAIQASITYVPYNITEKLVFGFDQNNTVNFV